MAKTEPKTRVTLRLSSDAAALLNNAAGGRYGEQSAIADRAIKFFFSPGEDQWLNVLSRRLDAMQGATNSIAEDHLVVMETLGLFIQFFMTITPPMPEDDREDAKALGLKRYDHFLGQLANRLRSNVTLADMVLEDKAALDDILASADLDPPIGVAGAAA